MESSSMAGNAQRIDICLHCLEQTSGDPCPRCGNDPKHYEGDNRGHLARGTVIKERYLLGRVLGAGGFGVTYLSHDLRLGARVAVKEYLPRDYANRDPRTSEVVPYPTKENDFRLGLESFREEGHVLGLLQEHPNVVSVHGFEWENGTAYLAMEFVDGQPLDKLLKDAGTPLPEQDVHEILSQVCIGLQAVHEKGILHRDLKPANLYWSRDRKITILDFGAARHLMAERTGTIAAVVAPGYAPPEQYMSHGRELQGPPTDIYALGATGYSLATGHQKPPGLPESLARKMGGAALVPPHQIRPGAISAGISRIITKAMEVDRTERYQSASEMLDDLQALKTESRTEPEEELHEIFDGTVATIIETAQCFATDEPEKAADQWRRATQAAPKSVMPRIELGHTLKRLEKWNAAADAYSDALRKMPEGYPRTRSQILLELLFLYREKLQLDVKVLDALKQLVKAQPKNLDFIDQLIEQNSKMKRLPDLVAALQAKADAVDSREQKVAIQIEIARIFIDRFSNQAEAIKAYERVLELDKSNQEAIDYLRGAYEKRRDSEKLSRFSSLSGREEVHTDDSDERRQGIQHSPLAQRATDTRGGRKVLVATSVVLAVSVLAVGLYSVIRQPNSSSGMATANSDSASRSTSDRVSLLLDKPHARHRKGLVKVGDFVGGDREYAIQELKAAGLRVKISYDQECMEGVRCEVVSVSPKPGTWVQKNSVVGVRCTLEAR